MSPFPKSADEQIQASISGAAPAGTLNGASAHQTCYFP